MTGVQILGAVFVALAIGFFCGVAWGRRLEQDRQAMRALRSLREGRTVRLDGASR